MSEYLFTPARLYTLVDPTKVRSSNPGCCFLKAGWQKSATSKTGKIILELLPPTQPQKIF